MNQTYAFITLLAVILGGVMAASYSTTETIRANPYADRYLLEKGTDLPKLWLYYDTNDVNARQWADFGARSSNALNVPFLNLCYGSIVAMNGHLYDIQIIGGLAGAAERLGGLPAPLHKQIERISAGDLNFIRAAILAKYGGLWIDPCTICLKSFGKLPENQVIFFGSDKDQTYAGPRGAAVPSLHAIWSPQPEHPVFVAWADAAFRRLVQLHTGGEARQDAKWDFVSFAAEQPGVAIIPSAELSRNRRTGKRLQLEELLAAGQEGALPFDVGGEAVYVPIPWKELRDRRAFGWFLRMSEGQIMDSDLVIRDLLLLTNQLPSG